MSLSELGLGLYLAGCMLLVGSGVVKLRRDPGAVKAVRRVWARAPAATARALGLVEVAVGVAGIVVGGAVAWLVAGLYSGLAVYTALSLRGAERVPCGCFGERSAPIHGVHVVFNSAFAGAAMAVAAAPSVESVSLIGDGLSSVLLWALSALCAWLAFVAMTAWVEVAQASSQERG